MLTKIDIEIDIASWNLYNVRHNAWCNDDIAETKTDLIYWWCTLWKVQSTYSLYSLRHYLLLEWHCYVASCIRLVRQISC